MRPLKEIVVHCSGTETGNAASIRKYHVKHNGWQDIGYHYVILRDGKIEDGRPLSVPGAHCPEANKTSVGICLIGNNTFTIAQEENLRFLINDLQENYGPLDVKGHREYPSAQKQGKTCPSDQIMDFISKNYGECIP